MALVVFLRGINVGGHRRFRPSALAADLKHLGAINIGAAGTFVIRRPITRSALRAELTKRLPFDARIAICHGRDIAQLLSHDHFAGQALRPDIVRFVSILSMRPRSIPELPIRLPAEGPWLVKILAREKQFVVGVYKRHMKVIGYLGSLDRLFGVAITTRNWNTISAVAKLLRTYSPGSALGPDRGT